MLNKIKKLLRENPLTKTLYFSFADLVKNSFLVYIKSEWYYSRLNPVIYTKAIFENKKLATLKVYKAMDDVRSREDLLKTKLGEYSHPVWSAYLFFLKDYLLTKLGEGFLKDKKIKHAISFNFFQSHQQKYLSFFSETDDVYADYAKNKFKDSRVGKPRIIKIGDFFGKPDSICHLFYFIRMMRFAQKKLDSDISIIELGGGYGNLAYCARLFNPKITYIIIDFPEMLSLVHLYHSINFPDQNIHVFEGNNGIKRGMLNLVPVNLITFLDEDFDFFMSTFALTESHANLINFVKKTNFFNSKFVYLQGGTDPVFNSHDNLFSELDKYINFSQDSFYAPEGCYEIIGTRLNDNKI